MADSVSAAATREGGLAEPIPPVRVAVAIHTPFALHTGLIANRPPRRLLRWHAEAASAWGRVPWRLP